MTAEGFTGMSTDGDGGGEAYDTLSSEFALAVADVQNCFHYLGIGERYGDLFCYLYRVTAKEMALVGHVVDGRRLGPDDRV